MIGHLKIIHKYIIVYDDKILAVRNEYSNCIRKIGNDEIWYYVRCIAIYLMRKNSSRSYYNIFVSCILNRTSAIESKLIVFKLKKKSGSWDNRQVMAKVPIN